MAGSKLDHKPHYNRQGEFDEFRRFMISKTTMRQAYHP